MFDNNKNVSTTQWIEYWLETYVRTTLKPAGYEHYADNCNKHILPKLGEIPVKDLTPARIQEFLNSESAHGNLRDGGPLSPKSVKNIRVVLDVALSRAVIEGVIASNPVPLTVIRKTPHKRVEVLSESNQQILEKYLFSCTDYYCPGITIALYTGGRLGEICALRWKNYDYDSATIKITESVKRLKLVDLENKNKTTLVFSAPKTEASVRTIALPDFLNEIIYARYLHYSEVFGHAPKQDDFVVFSSTGGITDPDNLSHYFGKVLKKLDIPHIKFHALRHTFASRAIENNVDVATVSGILGHSDVTTTTHYYIVPRDAAMRKAMHSIKPAIAG